MSLSSLSINVIRNRMRGMSSYDIGESAVASALKEFEAQVTQDAAVSAPSGPTDAMIQAAYSLLEDMRKESETMQTELAAARRALRSIRKIIKDQGGKA